MSMSEKQPSTAKPPSSNQPQMPESSNNKLEEIKLDIQPPLASTSVHDAMALRRLSLTDETISPEPTSTSALHPHLHEKHLDPHLHHHGFHHHHWRSSSHLHWNERLKSNRKFADDFKNVKHHIIAWSSLLFIQGVISIVIPMAVLPESQIWGLCLVGALEVATSVTALLSLRNGPSATPHRAMTVFYLCAAIMIYSLTFGIVQVLWTFISGPCFSADAAKSKFCAEEARKGSGPAILLGVVFPVTSSIPMMIAARFHSTNLAFLRKLEQEQEAEAWNGTASPGSVEQRRRNSAPKSQISPALRIIDSEAEEDNQRASNPIVISIPQQEESEREWMLRNLRAAQEQSRLRQVEKEGQQSAPHQQQEQQGFETQPLMIPPS